MKNEINKGGIPANIRATSHSTTTATTDAPASAKTANSALGQAVPTPSESTKDLSPAAEKAEVETLGTPVKKSLREQIAEATARKKPRQEMTRPLLRKCDGAQEWWRTLADWSRGVTMIDAKKIENTGCYVVTDDVADYIINAGRGHRILFEAIIRLSVNLKGNAFLNFAKIADANWASSYADAIDASETEWIWAASSDNGYEWGPAPESGEEIRGPKWVSPARRHVLDVEPVMAETRERGSWLSSAQAVVPRAAP